MKLINRDGIGMIVSVPGELVFVLRDVDKMTEDLETGDLSKETGVIDTNTSTFCQTSTMQVYHGDFVQHGDSSSYTVYEIRLEETGDLSEEGLFCLEEVIHADCEGKLEIKKGYKVQYMIIYDATLSAMIQINQGQAKDMDFWKDREERERGGEL